MTQAIALFFSRNLKRDFAGLLLGLFLIVEAMSIVPTLHSCIHKDAADSDHQCAVTMLSHGQVDCPGAPVVIIDAQPPIEFTPSAQIFVLVSIDVQLLPSRGPPSC